MDLISREPLQLVRGYFLLGFGVILILTAFLFEFDDVDV